MRSLRGRWVILRDGEHRALVAQRAAADGRFHKALDAARVLRRRLTYAEGLVADLLAELIRAEAASPVEIDADQDLHRRARDFLTLQHPRPRKEAQR